MNKKTKFPDGFFLFKKKSNSLCDTIDGVAIWLIWILCSLHFVDPSLIHHVFKTVNDDTGILCDAADRIELSMDTPFKLY